MVRSVNHEVSLLSREVMDDSGNERGFALRWRPDNDLRGGAPDVRRYRPGGQLGSASPPHRSVTPGKRSNTGRSCLDEHEALILDLIEARRDITLGEMVQCLDEVHGLCVQPSTLWYFLDRRDLAYKEIQAMPANRTDPMSPSAA